MTKFFEKINYSASNEDGFSEINALKISKEDVVLSITGSGSRSLDLLLSHPKKVISIDFNKTQNYLLKLKIAGYKYLDYEEFLELLGVKNKKNSLKIFDKIKDFLDSETKNYFEENKKLFKNGIIYSGTWEKILIFISKLGFLRKNKTEKLFSFESTSEQKKYFIEKYNNFVLKIFLKIITNRFLWEKVIKEPGIYLIKKDFEIYKYFQEKLENLAGKGLLKENDFANLIFFGFYKYSLPIHLRKENFEIIKNNIGKIEVITQDLNSFLQKKSNLEEITAFSLSDFSSYAPLDIYNKIRENIVNNSKNGTKFCERQFLVKNNPEEFFPLIKRDKNLEDEIENEDKTFVYSFCIGKILK